MQYSPDVRIAVEALEREFGAIRTATHFRLFNQPLRGKLVLPQKQAGILSTKDGM